MKSIMYRLIVPLLIIVGIIACDNKDYRVDSPFENVAYLEAAETNSESNFTFKRTLETARKEIAAMLAYPATADIDVILAAEPALAEVYNQKHGTQYAVLDARHYSVAAQSARIAAGETLSKPIAVEFKDLTALEIDAKYLLPVTIRSVSGGMGILEGSRTLWYVVSRSSAITSAASLKDNYFEVPGFDAGSPSAKVVNNLTQMTYEAIIRVNTFENNISSIMGIEQYCLFRLGDSGFPPQQLMFCSPGDVKFPKADKTKLLKAGEWYHVAITYDTENKTAVMYVDGNEQSRMEEYGNGKPVDLGKQARGKDFMFKIGHSYGDPEDYSRQLNGEICEVRVWNTVRTQKEIWDNMYNIDPQTPGLKAYWKFDEGEGDTVIDQTGNGNNAIAHNKAVWPNGIEVPMKNRN